MAAAVAAQFRLTPRTSRSHFGTVLRVGAEVAAPTRRTLTSGGNLNVQSMELGAACRGYVTDRPDVIVHYTQPGPRLRFAVRGGGDTTLIVHTPDGRWLCDDDGGGDLNPLIEHLEPAAGQYDVWVGSYRIGEYHPASLSVGP